MSEDLQRHRFFQPSPFAKLSMRSCGLDFKDSAKEKGYACVVMMRLARAIRNLVGLWIVCAIFKIVFDMTLGYTPGVQDPQVYFEAKLASASVDLLMLLVSILLLGAALLSLRRPVFTCTQLEGIIVVGIVIILLIGPFVPLRHSRRVILRKEDVAFEDDLDAEVMVTLLFDVLTTMVSLTPARFKSIWVIYAFAIVWYPLSRIVLIGSELRSRSFFLQSTFIIALTLMAMAGKVMMEIQERREFITVAKERALRAETEFRLSQQETHAGKARVRSEVSAAVGSCDTADIFDASNAIHADDTKATLKRIRALAKHEHWLIEGREVQLNVSKILGRGGFGAVVGGFMNGLPVAVKVSTEKIGTAGVERICSLIGEVRVLRKLRHPCIVTFYGAIIDPDTFDVAAVLELALGPCLADFMKMAQTPLADEQSYRVSCSMASALHYLHGHQPAIVHADLKPSNIMVELAGCAASRVKLVDFGLSRILKGSVHSLGGTLAWTAPELLASNDVVPTQSMDVYGLGRIMLFVLSGAYPFIGWSRQDIRESLLAGAVPGHECPVNATQVHLDLWKLGKVCTSLKPRSRPPTAQVCSQLQGLGALSCLCDQLRATSIEIWGWSDLDSKKTSAVWETAMPQLRHILSRDIEGAVEGQVAAPLGQGKAQQHSRSSSSSVFSSSTAVQAAEKSPDAKEDTILSPIIECLESNLGSRSRTPQSSIGSGNAVPEAPLADGAMQAALTRVFGDSMSL